MSPRTRFTEIDSRQPVADDPAMAKSQGLFRSVWLWWGVTLAYWLTIFVLTHIPQQRVPKIGGGDKLAHLGAYLVLSYLIYISGWIQNPARRNWAIIVLAICIVYGAVDELTQPLVNRFADWLDWYFNVLGSLIGTALALLTRMTCLQNRPIRPADAA